MVPAYELRRALALARGRHEAFTLRYTPLVAAHTNAIWTNTKITAHDSTSVTISPVPANGTRLRYLWYGNPCGLSCFECAVYTAVTPLGGLSGEKAFLPLAPFIMHLPPKHA